MNRISVKGCILLLKCMLIFHVTSQDGFICFNIKRGF